MRLRTIILTTCIAACANLLATVAFAETEYVDAPPARDWRQGPPPPPPPPPRGAPSTQQDCAEGENCVDNDLVEAPLAEQQDLSDNITPEPPNPHDREPPLDDNGRPIPPPPPGYENLLMPGEPPRN